MTLFAFKTYILLQNLNVSGRLVERVVPPMIGELLGRVVAHAARVKLQVRTNRFRDSLIRFSEAGT